MPAYSLSICYLIKVFKKKVCSENCSWTRTVRAVVPFRESLIFVRICLASKLRAKLKITCISKPVIDTLVMSHVKDAKCDDLIVLIGNDTGEYAKNKHNTYQMHTISVLVIHCIFAFLNYVYTVCLFVLWVLYDEIVCLIHLYVVCILYFYGIYLYFGCIYLYCCCIWLYFG